jgi:patatin-like phospholipase/acyl hydrolase
MTNASNPPNRVIKVLSIDGGGVRGLIPVRILQEIETRTNKPIPQLFDIITGTSTGGLITSALITPNQKGTPRYNAKDLMNFYLNDSLNIFAPSIFRKVLIGFGLWGSKYDRSNYDQILLQTFGNTLLSQALCPIFIPIYAIDKNKPFIASSFFAKQSNTNDFYLKDIVAATSAAPTYFTPVKFKNLDNSVSYTGADGGIYANNPELVGITGVYIMYPHLEIQNIVLLSIGTGESQQDINTQHNGNNGEIGWLKNKDIIGDMIDAESVLAEAAITAMLKHNSHFRFQVSLPKNLTAMDNSSSSNLSALVTIAEDFITQNSEQIDALCKVLCK